MPWNWLSFVVGAICGVAIGSFFGIFMMCVVSIGRCKRCEKTNKEDRDV